MYKLVKGDITELDVDVIVNAANTRLQRGGGVCGAIFNKAGEQLDIACQHAMIGMDVVPVGSCVPTTVNGLRQSHIYHTVGPIYNKNDPAQCELQLRAAYRNTIDTFIDQYDGKGSIAFPFISSGIYGYPVEECARIAHDELSKVDINGTIYMCTFSDDDYNLFKDLLDGEFIARIGHNTKSSDIKIIDWQLHKNAKRSGLSDFNENHVKFKDMTIT